MRAVRKEGNTVDLLQFLEDRFAARAGEDAYRARLELVRMRYRRTIERELAVLVLRQEPWLVQAGCLARWPSYLMRWLLTFLA
jgi:hypothetical protein